MTRTCPNCKLFNPPDALICDCGYDFVSEQASTDDSRRQLPMGIASIMFSFSGRIKRGTFWKAILSTWLLMLVWLIFLGITLGSGDQDGVIPVLFFPLLAVAVWCSYAIYAKRWHDRDKSGWWSLILFIPLIGWPWMLIELGFLTGTNGRNRYGRQP